MKRLDACAVKRSATPPASSASSGGNGFILVAVLLLIALVTVLVAATSMLARLERNAVTSATNTELARQNALFGLDAALAQLQKTMGRDQAVSARADILDTGLSQNLSANLLPGVTGVVNPYWTGAWKTFNPNGSSQNLDVDSSGNAGPGLLRNWSTAPTSGRPDAANLNMEWLVSGVAADHVNAVANGTKPKIIPTTWTPVVGAGGSVKRNAVVVARLPDLTQPQPTMVMANIAAPLVPLQAAGAAPSAAAPTTGQYAYWVSDEGVKAKANLSDPTLDPGGSSSYTKNQSHFLASQANLLTNVLPVVSGSDLRSDTGVPKVSTLQSLAFLPSVTGAQLLGSGASRFAPDVTTYSLGVLADVRNGGLKRDLTAAFEDDKTVNPSGQFQALMNGCGTKVQDQQAVYRSSNAALAVPVQSPPAYTGTTTIDGLRWESLYQYYNLYKSTIPLWRTNSGAAGPPSGVPASNLGFAASAPYSLQQRQYSYNDGGGGTFAIDPIAPVVIGARIDIGVCSFVDPLRVTTGSGCAIIRHLSCTILTACESRAYRARRTIFTRIFSTSVVGIGIVLQSQRRWRRAVRRRDSKPVGIFSDRGVQLSPGAHGAGLRPHFVRSG